MKVKILDSNLYLGQSFLKGKVVPAVYFEDLPDDDPVRQLHSTLQSTVPHSVVFICGSDLIKAGAPEYYFGEESYYAFGVGTDAEIVEQ